MITHFLLATPQTLFQKNLQQTADVRDCFYQLQQTCLAEVKERLSQSPMLDFVFIDCNLLSQNSIQDVYQLRQTSPLSIIIVLTHKHQEKTWGFLLDAGVHAFLPITSDPETIQKTLQQFNTVDACNPVPQINFSTL